MPAWVGGGCSPCRNNQHGVAAQQQPGPEAHCLWFLPAPVVLASAMYALGYWCCCLKHSCFGPGAVPPSERAVSCRLLPLICPLTHLHAVHTADTYAHFAMAGGLGFTPGAAGLPVNGAGAGGVGSEERRRDFGIWGRAMCEVQAAGCQVCVCALNETRPPWAYARLWCTWVRYAKVGTPLFCAAATHDDVMAAWYDDTTRAQLLCALPPLWRAETRRCIRTWSSWTVFGSTTGSNTARPALLRTKRGEAYI